MTTCGLCGRPTPMHGTKRCDRCYELESRIRDNPELAVKVLLADGATFASERAALVKAVGECCQGSDPLCYGGCLVQQAIGKRLAGVKT